jgi:cytochrome c-type biogenesis protein CcmH
MRAAALAGALLLSAATLGAQSSAPSTAPALGVPAAADARSVLGMPGGPRLDGPALDARTNDVASLLRCPVCQGLSVADSPSTMALNMKGQVRDLLAAGYDGEQVLTYFERSYGEFVRLQPPLRGINWLLWLAPGVALVVGAAVVWRTAQRAGARGAAETAAAPAPAVAAAPLDPKLEAYRARVRSLAYGEAPAEPAAGTPATSTRKDPS